MKEEVLTEIPEGLRPARGMDWAKLVRSFKFAFAGLLHVFRTEQNMKVHVILGVVVIGLGFFFRIAIVEWCMVVICMGVVLAAECVNSALERLADRVTREEHFLIKAAKDAAAGGVLLAALTAAAVGLLIFVPKFLAWIAPWVS